MRFNIEAALEAMNLKDGSYIVTDDLLTKKQLIEALGICRKTIQNWQKQGMPFEKFENNKNGYNLEEVKKWAKENKVAIEEYNERIRKHGVFSDSFRSF